MTRRLFAPQQAFARLDGNFYTFDHLMREFEDIIASREHYIPPELTARDLLDLGTVEGWIGKEDGEWLVVRLRSVKAGSAQNAPEHVEALGLLCEEAGEFCQSVGKALRHGLASYDPSTPNVMNRDDIEKEAGDVLAAIEIACRRGMLSRECVVSRREQKLRTIPRWLHFTVDGKEKS